MNLTLLSFGLLMIAAAMTVLAGGPRTWLLAFSQGLGIQAVIGGAVSVVQTCWLQEGAADQLPAQKIITAVQGIVFNSAGWTSRSIFEQMTNDAHAGAMSDLGDYLPVAGAQIGLVALVIAWRKMQDEALCDVVVLFAMGLVLANSVCNVYWPWWGA